MTLNRENLKIAIEGLKALNIPEDGFDMENYGGIVGSSIDNYRRKINNPCGTVACALGWCPYIKGLEPIKEDFIDGRFHYNKYCRRIFKVYDYDDKWDFMYCKHWREHDNTLPGAIARMQWVYDGKYKDNWKYEDFKRGWHN